MAARPSWRGQIRLALVAIPVEISPATKAGRSLAFHQIHELKGGNAFTIRDIDRLIDRAASKLLAGWGQARQALPDA